MKEGLDFRKFSFNQLCLLKTIVNISYQKGNQRVALF